MTLGAEPKIVNLKLPPSSQSGKGGKALAYTHRAARRFHGKEKGATSYAAPLYFYKFIISET